ncbi:hypothetical protein AB0M80_23600 [Amycolatopsis sp. NPDC051045]|uniref:hypothetical protein n=1 Tax=Amycolatopsis sp. NPDC051045 TaxID=3156922 RepID=UPI003433A5D6
MSQGRGQLAVGAGLVEQELGFALDVLDGVGAGDEAQWRLVLTCDVDQCVGELGGAAVRG